MNETEKDRPMTAITVAATITVLAAFLVPAVAEVQRIRAERANPIRKLRVQTRRNQVLLTTTSGSFIR